MSQLCDAWYDAMASASHAGASLGLYMEERVGVAVGRRVSELVYNYGHPMDVNIAGLAVAACGVWHIDGQALGGYNSFGRRLTGCPTWVFPTMHRSAQIKCHCGHLKNKAFIFYEHRRGCMLSGLHTRRTIYNCKH